MSGGVGLGGSGVELLLSVQEDLDSVPSTRGGGEKMSPTMERKGAEVGFRGTIIT